jgi:hypothetical protein
MLINQQIPSEKWEFHGLDDQVPQDQILGPKASGLIWSIHPRLHPYRLEDLCDVSPRLISLPRHPISSAGKPIRTSHLASAGWRAPRQWSALGPFAWTFGALRFTGKNQTISPAKLGEMTAGVEKRAWKWFNQNHRQISLKWIMTKWVGFPLNQRSWEVKTLATGLFYVHGGHGFCWFNQWKIHENPPVSGGHWAPGWCSSKSSSLKSEDTGRMGITSPPSPIHWNTSPAW